MYTLGVNLNVNAGNARQQFKDAKESVEDYTQALREAREAGDWKNAAIIAGTINSLSNAERQQYALYQQQVKQESGGSPGGSGQGQPQGQGLVNAANTGSGYINQYLGGDSYGAMATAAKNAGSSMRDYSAKAAKEGRDNGLTDLIGKMGVAGVLAGIGMSLVGSVADKYEAALPAMHGANRLYSGSADAVQNNRAAIAAYKSAGRNYAKDTGLSIDEFLEASADAAGYGYKTQAKALEATRTAALWSNYTGADMGLAQGVLGTANRYGDNSNVLGLAFAASQQQGLNKAQYGEFLAGIQSAMESGISKGFAKTAESITDTASFFASMNGNDPLWTGENGMRRIQGMDNAVANATNLQSTGDVLMAQAAQNVLDTVYSGEAGAELFKRDFGIERTGGYADLMMVLEKGQTPELFSAFMDLAKGLAGENTQELIEWVKGGFGLNYVSAAQLVQNSEKTGGSEAYKDYKQAKTNPIYRSDETDMQNAANGLQASVIGIEKKAFDFKLTGMEGVNEIATKLDEAIDKMLSKIKEPEVSDGMVDKVVKDLGGDASIRDVVEELAKPGSWYAKEETRGSALLAEAGLKEDAYGELFAEGKTRAALQAMSATNGNAALNETSRIFGYLGTKTEDNRDSLVFPAGNDRLDEVILDILAGVKDKGNGSGFTETEARKYIPKILNKNVEKAYDSNDLYGLTKALKQAIKEALGETRFSVAEY